ncbi:hypothetical protein LCGC14_2269410 [marine sediment metagenome]|uniref:Uncharacterized protein n=1 Tax=marine sediment metagenome TaxID=412755 RepID=A0A0F9F9U2_9ZZZZ
MYKAIQEIGGYKIGNEVPAEKAELWLSMYSVPPVEKVAEDATGQDSKSVPEEKEESVPEKKELESGKESSENVMLDDYLGRNTNVVISNIKKDNLSKEQLDGLLVLEESNKKREGVIKAIKKKLDK